MNENDIPTISPALVEALKARFPVPIPKIEDGDRVIWHRLGAWSVIQFLEAQLKEQTENHVRSLNP